MLRAPIALAVGQMGVHLVFFLHITTGPESTKAAALKFMKKLMKRNGTAKKTTTDDLRAYKAAMKELGNADKQVVGRYANNRVENSHQPFRRRDIEDAAAPALTA